MAVEIKSGDSSDVASVHPVAKAVYVIPFSSDGHEGIHSVPVPISTGSVDEAGEFVLPAFDASDYKFVSLQLEGTWVATVIFEGSNDNATFYPIATTDPSGADTGKTTATSNRIVIIPTSTTYVRARILEYTSGAITSTAVAYKDENSSGLISTIGAVTLSDSPAETYAQVITAATTNATSVTSGATKLRTISLVNGVATLRFFKIYDKATAPTVGTDTPVLTLTMSPNNPSPFTLPNGGLSLSLGFAYAMTLGVANSDTTADSVVGAITGILGYTE